MLTTLLSLLVVLPLQANASDDALGLAEVKVQEWKVPYPQSRPRDPALDSQSRVWFCGQSGNYIAMLDPASGEFKRFELPDNTHPHNLIIDKQDFVWYAGNRNSHIGKLDPNTGAIQQFAMPDGQLGDPHTMVFDKNGDIWFTSQWANAVGWLDVKNGDVQQVKMTKPQSRPYGIKLDSDGNPWVVLFGSNEILRINAKSLEQHSTSIPAQNARPRRLEIGSNDVVWYADYSSGMLGSYQPDDFSFTTWMLPDGAKAKPYGTAIDKKGRIWVAETGLASNQVVVFDPSISAFVAKGEVPSCGGSVRYMIYDDKTNAVWFGTDTNYIGKAQIVSQD